MEHDPDGTFIKKWIPELQNIPDEFIHQPYLMTAMEQKLHNFMLGEDYPLPIVDIKTTRRFASDTLWSLKDDPLVKRENYRILKRHTLPDRNNFD